MSVRTDTRKWTADVSVGGQSFGLTADDYADVLCGDTLRDTVARAKTIAESAIEQKVGSDASIIVFKQLKGDSEPVRDRSFYGYRDWDRSGRARIVWQYRGA